MNYLELRKMFKEEEKYEVFLKDVSLNCMTSYPIYIYKNHFLSKNILALIKDKDVNMYNILYEEINKSNCVEIKID